MTQKNIILILLSIVSLAVFAQNDYYYYKGQRIPLTINPKKVNVITPISNIQHAPSSRPQTLKAGLEIENVIINNNQSMCIIKEDSAYVGVLNQYLDSIIEEGNNKILPCYYNSRGEELISSGYLYVKVKAGIDSIYLSRILSRFRLLVDHRNIYMPSWYILSTTTNDERLLLSRAEQLLETGYFDVVEPDLMHKYTFSNISWDEDITQQWGLYNALNETIDINASSAWNYATGRGIKIGIFDSGLDHNHIDLIDNLSCLCYDIETGTNNHVWYVDHGTHIAGIAAGIRNNGKFGAGVAPEANLVSISTRLNNFNSLTTEKIANGFNWAAQNGIDIINCSWFWGPYEIISESIDNAINNGRNGKGSILVIAAGNFGNFNNITNKIPFPGNYRSEILTVGAITKNGIRASFSSYGSALDVVAPGDSIYSTLPNNNYGYKNGTSMAAPHVAGIAALILELNPDLTGQQVRDIIEQSTTKVGNLEYTNTVGRPNGTWNVQYGYGLVDALKAVQNTPRKQIDY